MIKCNIMTTAQQLVFHKVDNTGEKKMNIISHKTQCFTLASLTEHRSLNSSVLAKFKSPSCKTKQHQEIFVLYSFAANPK